MTGAVAGPGRGRYEFLDALRGVAAMAVVVQHALELLYPGYAKWTITYFRPGEFGVVVFFLCSGFIIPASLERHRSQGRFWTGRFFRLYPLYWAALAAVLVLHFGFERYPLDAQFHEHPVRLTLANATMIQDFLNVPLALGQSWTLAYEMAFYGLVAALFVAGLERRSSPIALAGFAIAAVVGSTFVPTHALSTAGPRGVAAIVAGSLVVAVVMLRVTRRAGATRWLAVAIGVAAVPLIVNRPEAFNTTAMLIGTLFAGTVIYRWTIGEVTTGRLAVVLGAAAAAIVAMYFTTDVWWLERGPGDDLKQAVTATYLGAYAVFMGAVLIRSRRFPRSLIYLGTVSYSLYLVHSIVIYGVGRVGDQRSVSAAVWVVLTVVVSAITYRFIEQPAIDYGRRLGASRTATAPAAW